MKRSMALMLVLTMVATMLSGCAGTTVVIGNCNCPTGDTAQPSTPTVPAEGALKTGLSVSVSLKDSASASAEEKGAAQYDVTLAAVTVDDKGVIVSCVIDSIPATVEFDGNGAVTSDLTAAIQTKNELGDNYGMVALGGAKAEWHEQVAAVARYAVGKTVEQLKNGDIDMTTGMAKDGTDLQSSATIYLAGYVYAIEAAVNNAKHLGAQAGDTLVLATLPSIGNSVSASADNAGVAQLDADFVALTKKGDTITSCCIDALQAKVAFDAEGNITTDLTAAVKTKNELGSDYGMVALGGAKAEWYEQAASFAQYVTGKTLAEVEGIAVGEKTQPADGTDLSSSVTIAIGGFKALIAKAMK